MEKRNYNDVALQVRKNNQGEKEYFYIDESGKEKQFFSVIKHKECVIVQIKENGPYHFIDLGDKLSESFNRVGNYVKGFTFAQRKKGDPLMVRDLLGRITEERTASGYDFYRFIKGDIDAQDLNPKYFDDATFSNGVQDEIARREDLKAQDDARFGA